MSCHFNPESFPFTLIIFLRLLIHTLAYPSLFLPPCLPPFPSLLLYSIKQYARVQAIEKQRALMESGQGEEAGGHGGGGGH